MSFARTSAITGAYVGAYIVPSYAREESPVQHDGQV